MTEYLKNRIEHEGNKQKLLKLAEKKREQVERRNRIAALERAKEEQVTNDLAKTSLENSKLCVALYQEQ